MTGQIDYIAKQQETQKGVITECAIKDSLGFVCLITIFQNGELPKVKMGDTVSVKPKDNMVYLESVKSSS